MIATVCLEVIIRCEPVISGKGRCLCFYTSKVTPIMITNLLLLLVKVHLNGQHTNYWTHSRIITNFETGRTSVEDLVRRLTFMMKSLQSGYTSRILPSNQEPRGALEYTTTTTSPLICSEKGTTISVVLEAVEDIHESTASKRDH